MDHGLDQGGWFSTEGDKNMMRTPLLWAVNCANSKRIEVGDGSFDSPDCLLSKCLSPAHLHRKPQLAGVAKKGQRLYVCPNYALCPI